MKDFDFELKINTVSFDISLPGERTITVKGNKMSAEANAAIARAKTGSRVSIFNIRAVVSGSTYELKKIYGGSIRIRN
jgi:hypothetical protein